MRIILEKDGYRIVEHVDPDFVISDLRPEGDDPEAFEAFVNRHGVFGYELERWNPAVGQGWEHVDSCWGFVGQFSDTDETFRHYIVDEFQSRIGED